MKHKLIIPSGIPRSAYNQWVKLMIDNKFWGIVNNQKNLLEKLSNKIPTSSFTRNCRRYIKTYLTDKQIPYVWITPIYNLITNDTLDFPLHNSISLFVGTQEVTGATKTLLRVKNIKTGEIIDNRNLSLVISSKVSADQIIKFIKDNKKDIEMWQDFYELPEYKNPVWKKTNLALDIIEMKDKKGMSFSDISNILSDNQELSTEEVDYLASADNIKTLYHRYKKYFKS